MSRTGAPEEAQTKQWSGGGQLRGGRVGIWFFITALRVLGLRLTYGLAIPTAIYFSFVSPDVPATMDYHRRVYGPLPWWKRRWLVFKHFFKFGQALIDRTAILAGAAEKFSFTFDGEHHLREAVRAGKGVLLLTAHVGNWEAAGQLLSRLEAPVNVTGFDHETPAIRALLDKSSSAKFRLIPLTDEPTDAIQIIAALRRGEVVAMMGDRTYKSSSANVPFYGGTAPFPIGAYVMASVAGAPLAPVFSLREAGGHYRFFGFPTINPMMPRRAERAEYLRACAAGFAGALETIVQRDPLQWYNFFPFWDQPTRAATPARGALKTEPAHVFPVSAG